MLLFSCDSYYFRVICIYFNVFDWLIIFTTPARLQLPVSVTYLLTSDVVRPLRLREVVASLRRGDHGDLKRRA